MGTVLFKNLLNVYYVLAEGNEACNCCLKAGHFLQVNISQEVFVKYCNSGEQNY